MKITKQSKQNITFDSWNVGIFETIFFQKLCDCKIRKKEMHSKFIRMDESPLVNF